MENLLRYWCFACSNHFQSQKDTAACSLCHSEAVQLAEGNNNDPSQFPVYQILPQNPQQAQQQTPQEQNQNQDEIQVFFTITQFTSPQGFPPIVRRQIRIHYIDPTQNFNPFQHIFGSSGLINLLNSLRSQGNLVPASQQEKNRLQTIDRVSECSVCQQEQTDQSRKGYKLSCGHSFHIDCLDPWLERTNTCPTCRAHI